MVCKTCLQNVSVQAGQIGIFTQKGIQLSTSGAPVGLGFPYLRDLSLRTYLRMMVDTGATENREIIGGMMSRKEDNSGIASGSWRRLLLYLFIEGFVCLFILIKSLLRLVRVIFYFLISG